MMAKTIYDDGNVSINIYEWPKGTGQEDYVELTINDKEVGRERLSHIWRMLEQIDQTAHSLNNAKVLLKALEDSR
jgi:hypothetical protein